MCVWSGTLSASLTVQLYNGHSSTLSLTIFATNQTGFGTMFVQSINVMSPNLKNYTVMVKLSPGVYRFTVTANNSFGSIEKSPPFCENGWNRRFENSVKLFHFYWFICCLNFISVLTTSRTTTDSTNPISTNVVPVALYFYCSA